MSEPKLFVASSGGGIELKKEIVQYLCDNDKIHVIEDIGAHHNNNAVDFPTYALMVADLVKENTLENIGVLIGRTGNEMAVMANRIKDIRAAVCWNMFTAVDAREMLDANIICIPYTQTEDSHIEILGEFLRRPTSNHNVHFRRRWLLEKLTDAL